MWIILKWQIFSHRVLLSPCLLFSQFHFGIADKTVAYKKACRNVGIENTINISVSKRNKTKKEIKINRFYKFPRISEWTSIKEKKYVAKVTTWSAQNLKETDDNFLNHLKITIFLKFKHFFPLTWVQEKNEDNRTMLQRCYKSSLNGRNSYSRDKSRIKPATSQTEPLVTINTLTQNFISNRARTLDQPFIAKLHL